MNGALTNLQDRVDSRIEYTFEILLGAEWKRITQGRLHYGRPYRRNQTQRRLVIVDSGFFGPLYGTRMSLPRLPLGELEGLPILYGRPEIHQKGKDLTVYADIIASTFFLVTRYEEIVRRETRDQMGRFPGKRSLPYRAGFIHRPLVEEYVALIRKWLSRIGLAPPPDQRQFSILLTHDVDTPREYCRLSQPLRTLTKVVLGQRRPSALLDSALTPLGIRRDPFDNFELLTSLDATLCRKGIASAYYFFLAGGKKPQDGFYNVKSPYVRTLMRKITESGANIGLHASFAASSDLKRIKQERANLQLASGCDVTWNRFHNLAWREVEDGWALSDAGLLHDSTLGYADIAGFRLGVCRPIPLYDPTHRKRLAIIEHPLTVMDVTLDRADYMNLAEEDAFKYVCKLMDAVRLHQGEAVLLWHNSELVPTLARSYQSTLYRQVLTSLV